MSIKVFRPPNKATYVEGAMTLGLEIRNITKLIQQLEEGLEPDVATRLAKRMGLPLENLLMLLGISSRSIKTALENKKRLSRPTSKILYRIARVLERALDVFQGDEEKAVRWLITPKFGLGNEIPLKFAGTEVGGECVFELLQERVQGGVA